MFFRNNVDCDAAEGLYGLAEGAFRVEANAPDADGQSGGSCPVVDPLSDAECAGAVSTCWSPGQPDTDCPDFGICCFDGCANTCEGEGKIFIMILSRVYNSISNSFSDFHKTSKVPTAIFRMAIID